MLAILPWVIRVPSGLSIFGSTTIVYIILSDRQRNLKHPRNRLMLMMSIFDLFSSTAFFTSSWAEGNSRSCIAQGIGIWLGGAVPLYNSSLSLYYLLTIKYGMNQQRFSNQIEPLLHLISIVLPLSAAVIAAVRGHIMPGSTHRLCSTTSTIMSILIISGIAFSFLFCVFSMSSIVWSMKQRPTSLGSSVSTRRRMEEMETVKTAILYTSAFFITFIGLLCQEIIKLTYRDEGSFYLTILIGISYPLQGFWNLAIYVRPGVNRIRERDKDKSLIGALREVIFPVRSNTNSQIDIPNEDVPIPCTPPIA